jgi:hypothetical protein
MGEILKHYGGASMGLGFYLDGEDDSIRLSHSGCNQGFESEMVFYEENGKGIVVMINSQAGDLISEIERAAAYTYDWEGFLPEDKDIMDVDESKIKTYLGKYMSDSNIVMNIENKNNSIFIVPEDQNSIKLHRRTENEFFAKEVNADIRFVVDEKGSINGMKICQNGRELFFKK